MGDADRPAWFDQLASTYLAGESSLFLVHGGDEREVEAELLRELSRTRPVVGVVRPDRGLEFANLSDRSRFEQILAGRAVVGALPPLGEQPRSSASHPDFTLSGRATSTLRSTRPLDALAQIWAVLEVADPPQAWIVADAAALFPPKKHPDPLGGGAPRLADWALAPRLRENNHVVVLVGDPARIHPDLARAAKSIDATPVLRLVHDAARHQPPPAEPGAGGPTDESVNASGAGAPPDLADRLGAALGTALAGWPAAAWPSRAPVMAAVARALAELPDPPCGPVEIRWDAESGATAEGPGSGWFLERWRSDVAIDAAAGMIARGLTPPEAGYEAGGVPPVDPVGTRVLAKRVGRWFGPSA